MYTFYNVLIAVFLISVGVLSLLLQNSLMIPRRKQEKLSNPSGAAKWIGWNFIVIGIIYAVVYLITLMFNIPGDNGTLIASTTLLGFKVTFVGYLRYK